MARGLLRIRAARTRSFPSDLFDEHGWVILLHLFTALVECETVSEGELIRRVGGSARIGDAWLNHLVADGQVVARSGGDDVQMTPAAIHGMRTFLDEALAIRAAPIGC